MDQVVSESIGDWQFYMRTLAIFAGIALLLAVVGIYGVMSYLVSERTHEFGIRVALGALPSDVLSLVGNLGLRLTLIGVVIGILLAVGLTRLIADFLVEVKPTDPVTYAVVSVVLVGVALLACYIPARRATKVDPMLIDDADRPAKWYFQLKAAHLESKRTGTEMTHPMAGPVTLKWRS